MSIQEEPTPVTPGSYPRERVFPGALKRLLTEDWGEMTAAANSSPNHVSDMRRWIKQAKKENPRLNDDQAYRLARQLKYDFYQNLSEAGVQARRLATDIEAIEGTDDR